MALAGCAAERAIALSIDVSARGETLCLGVTHPSLDPPLRYGWALDAIAPPYSVSLVPGALVASEVRVASWTLDAARASGRGAATLAFPERGVSSARLSVRACAPHARSVHGTRQGGTFASLRAPPLLLAGDLDADGRDELLAVGADGSLQVLDAEDPSRGSVRRTELLTLDGGLSDVADLDGDCAFDLAAASSTGALVVDGESGRSLAPIDVSTAVVRIGPFGPGGEPGLLVGGSAGLVAIGWPSGARDELSAEPITSLDVRRLDGRLRALASGPSGAALFALEGGVVAPETDDLPAELRAASGPVALTSFGLVAASGRALLFGVLEASGLRLVAGPELEAEVTRLLAIDLDGDCVDEVVARADDGSWSVYRGSDLEPLAAPRITTLDLTAGDVDGDGEPELALLGAGGRVTLFAP